MTLQVAFMQLVVVVVVILAEQIRDQGVLSSVGLDP